MIASNKHSSLLQTSVIDIWKLGFKINSMNLMKENMNLGQML